MEDVHFRREWYPAEAVGHRCLARGLSDIAAMGGEPVAVFLSLALPARLPQKWVDGFMKGFVRLAKKFNVPLAGGDTGESPAGVLADIVVLGSAPKGSAVLRSGARPGDLIYVTGAVGGSAAALASLRRGKKIRASEYERHFWPTPRIRVGRFLREHKLVSSMIDLSDGLSTDLSHICDESRVGAEIERKNLPLASVGKPPKVVDLEFGLHGGEDYELLFTAHPGKNIPSRIAGVTVTRIGQITSTRSVFIDDGRRRSKLQPRGWEHFRG